MVLGMMQIVTAHKWYVKCTILIDNNFFIIETALIDSGAHISCIQEGLIPTRYYHKTSHNVKSASGNRMQIEYKLPNAYICQQKVCIPHFFILVKDHLNPPIILGTLFIQAIYPFTRIDEKGFDAVYNGKKISFTFITDLISRDINTLINLKQSHLNYLQYEIYSMTIDDTLKSAKI